ncbi:predicted protein [Sclerotinia sclerotiorum 1980 UF-70]|uniref:Uncharacterized protein n=1 Tax=Sclerotinia sclerotiorum (strain ATCC 18683 / 1980 / Ss-1) TaxID=665079 RepID=A7F414_SCLS1|nr:predicted protein [Sclerotinia sclerotiorum 1980 UF-70]EDN97485.1 predicted protein [Sclerotinia sclerotiorum 1980 UF-70]
MCCTKIVGKADSKTLNLAFSDLNFCQYASRAASSCKSNHVPRNLRLETRRFFLSLLLKFLLIGNDLSGE